MKDLTITEETVKVLSEIADLPLDEHRYKIIAPELQVWINAANSLNEKMSAEEHLTLTPITVLSHAEKNNQEEK